MPSNPELTSIRPRAAPAASISTWPLRDEPARTAGLVFAEVAAGLIAARWSQSPGMGLLVAGLLGLASWQFLVPASYELNSKGIQRRRLFARRRVSWIEFEGFDVLGNAVFLRHQTHRDPFGSVRGLFLPLRRNPAEVIAVLEYYLRPRSSDGITTTQTLSP